MAGVLFGTTTVDDPSTYNVHLGTWTNWSRGPVFGGTLTLNRRQGSFLISFTAFFITIVASRFWRIACSILHRKLSADGHRDALHHQRQAVFRNSTSSEAGLWSLFQISWAWRHVAQRSLNRTLPHIFFASVCLLAFSLASGFSSSISTAIGDEVLIDGANCGYLEIYDKQTAGPWLAGVANNAAGYAQQVYSPNSTGVFGNTVFVSKKLNTISNSEAPCPFKNNICRSNASNLLLDTGYLNICDNLGVNLPRDQSILYRTVLHCAPLITEDRSEPVDVLGLSNYTGYKYGPTILPSLHALNAKNYTFIIKDTYSQNMFKHNAFGFSGYGIETAYSLTFNGTSEGGTFYPDPDLRRPDADVYLFFLSGNGVVITEPVNDPWYRSNVLSNNSIHLVDGSGLPDIHPSESYRPAEAASPLGCATQYQLCKGYLANNNSCGPLASLNDAFTGVLPRFNVDPEGFSRFNTKDQLIEAYSSDIEASRILWLLQVLGTYPLEINVAAQILGSQSLASQRSLSNGVQGPLPNNQWQLDVSNWWNITLALLQASFVDTANGPTDPNVARLKKNATNPGQESFCQNQKILSPSYISVSLFGLYFTYIIGLLIIVSSYVLDPILSFAQKRWKYREYENIEWEINETLQLQRLAYEESGQGDWSRCRHSVPVTAANQELGPLNLIDPEHPRLRHPRSPRSSKEFPNSFPCHEELTEAHSFQEEAGLREEGRLRADGEYQNGGASSEVNQELAEYPQLCLGEPGVNNCTAAFTTISPRSPM